MKATVKLDYQPLDTFFVVLKNITFQMIGAYTITMDYSGCTVTSTLVAGE